MLSLSGLRFKLALAAGGRWSREVDRGRGCAGCNAICFMIYEMCVIFCGACAIIAASQALGCTRWHRFFAVSATELPCCFKNLRMEVRRPSAAGDKLQQQQQHEPRAAVSLAVSPSLPPPPLPSSRWGLLRSLRDAVAAGAVPPNVLVIARLCCLLCISGLWSYSH